MPSWSRGQSILGDLDQDGIVSQLDFLAIDSADAIRSPYSSGPICAFPVYNLPGIVPWSCADVTTFVKVQDRAGARIDCQGPAGPGSEGRGYLGFLVHYPEVYGASANITPSPAPLCADPQDLGYSFSASWTGILHQNPSTGAPTRGFQAGMWRGQNFTRGGIYGYPWAPDPLVQYDFWAMYFEVIDNYDREDATTYFRAFGPPPCTDPPSWTFYSCEHNGGRSILFLVDANGCFGDLDYHGGMSVFRDTNDHWLSTQPRCNRADFNHEMLKRGDRVSGSVASPCSFYVCQIKPNSDTQFGEWTNCNLNEFTLFIRPELVNDRPNDWFLQYAPDLPNILAPNDFVTWDLRQ